MANGRGLDTRTNIIIIGLVLMFALLVSIFVSTQVFGERYSEQVQIEATPKPFDENATTFSVQKITIKNLNTGEFLSFKKNGEASQFTDDTILHRKVLSNESILNLFNRLTQEEFEKLLTEYYSANQKLVITIETSYGTKVITIGEDGEEPLDDSLQDIIDESEDLEEELEQEPSPPPATPVPTPSPTLPPGTTPTPSPTPGFPTPTPDPSQPTPTPEPFRCDMLNQQGVTVSNIRCLEDEQNLQ